MKPRVMLVGPMPPTKGGVTTFMLNLMASPLADEVAFIPFTTSRPPKRNVTENWGYRAMLRGGVRRILAGALVTAWHVARFPVDVLRQRIDVVQIQASDYQVFWEAGLYAAMARLLRRPVLFRIGGAFDVFWGGASGLERRLDRGGAAAARHSHRAVRVRPRAVIRQAGRQGEIVLLPNWAHTPAACARSGGAMRRGRPACSSPGWKPSGRAWRRCSRPRACLHRPGHRRCVCTSSPPRRRSPFACRGARRARRDHRGPGRACRRARP